MGKRHAAAQAGIARAQADEAVREAESRRRSAEEERQLLTSYLGTRDQVAGTGRFSVNPETLKYTQRYNVDERALLDIQAAGQGIKRNENPFQGADNRVRGGLDLLSYGRGFANQANELLAQAEAAAQSGDLARAEQLFQQANQVISGISPEAQSAYNLSSSAASSAAIRASSAEGRLVGRQLLTAQELGDPNSETSTGLRGRLLDSALGQITTGEQGALDEINKSVQAAQQAIDANTRNAERAIASERGQVEGEIRQLAASGGTGFNARAQLAAQSQAASQAGLRRAQVYSTSAAQNAAVLAEAGLERAGIISDASRARAAITTQVTQYLNEFAKRMAEDSVMLAQDWVNGTAGVRDIYQESLTQLDLIQADMANQWAQIFAAQAEARRKEDKISKQVRRESIFGIATGALAVSTIFGGKGLGQTAGGVTSDTGVGAGAGSGLGIEAEGETGSFGEEGATVGAGSENVAFLGGSPGSGGTGGNGLGSLVATLFA